MQNYFTGQVCVSKKKNSFTPPFLAVISPLHAFPYSQDLNCHKLMAFILSADSVRCRFSVDVVCISYLGKEMCRPVFPTCVPLSLCR